MSFLAPVAGLIGAAIAVPLLIALYLLKLRRRPLRVSSTLLWEQAVLDLQANVPLRWLRWSWLLALQLAALGCVLIALARPAIPGALQRGASVVVLIDRSASMSAMDGERVVGQRRETRLEAAMREALEIVDQIGRASPAQDGRAPEAMIVAYAADARALTGFTSSTPELRDAVEGIDASDQPDNLDAAIELVRAMGTGRADESEGGRDARVVVITDHALAEGALAARLRSRATVRVLLVGPARSAREPGRAPVLPDNVGIVALGAVRDANAPATARLFARVLNAGAQEVEVLLSCRIDDRPAGIKALVVPPATLGPDGTTRPGMAAATIEMVEPSGGLVTATIARPDVLATDNQAALVLNPATRARVLVVGPGVGEDDPFRRARGEMGVDRFLLGSLQEMDLGALRIIDRATYEAGVANAESASGAWPEYDLIVFDRVSPRQVPARPTLSIGAGLPAIGVAVEESAGGVGGAGGATRFALWSRSHPVFRYASPDAVLISPPMTISYPQRAADGPGGAAGGAEATPHRFTELAQGAAGPLVLSIDDDAMGGIRRLVLGFDLLRTNWGPEVSFPVFIASAVEHLTGRGDAAAGVGYTTRQNISVTPSGDAAVLRVRGPREFDVPVSGVRGEMAAGESVSLGVLDRAGVYRVDGAISAQSVLAVNLLDDTESTLDTGARGEAAGGPGATGAGEADGGGGGRVSADGVREIWHWFLGLGAALSCLEWIVYALRSRTG